MLQRKTNVQDTIQILEPRKCVELQPETQRFRLPV